jgi:hypothetical protein
MVQKKKTYTRVPLLSYEETSAVLREAILSKFPNAKADEHRDEWLHRFDEYRQNPEKIADHLLWMIGKIQIWFKTARFSENPDLWIGMICGQMEGLGWINPKHFEASLIVDRGG